MSNTVAYENDLTDSIEVKNDNLCHLLFTLWEPIMIRILKVGFGSLAAVASILVGSMLFLTVLFNRKLRSSFRCHFLLMFLCDIILAFVINFFGTFQTLMQVSKSIDWYNFIIRIYSFTLSLVNVCEFVSDFLLISATVEVLVRVHGTSSWRPTALIRFFGIGLSIIVGIAIRYPFFDMFTIVSSKDGFCDAAVQLQRDPDFRGSKRFFYKIVQPILTTFAPFFIQNVLLSILGRQAKIKADFLNALKFTFPLLCAMTFTRIVPDMVQKSIILLEGLFFRRSFDLFIHLVQISGIFVDITRLFSYIALIYFDRDVRKVLRNGKIVQLPLQFLNFVRQKIPWCSVPVGWENLSSEESEYHVFEDADIEMDNVDFANQL